MKPEKQRFVQVVLYCANALVLLWGFLIVGILSVGMEKPTISEIEKRTLAAKPVFSVESFFSGQFSRDFEAYYADTFPCRDALVQTASAFNSLKGVTLGDMRVYETNAADTGAPANGEVAPASSVSADTTAEAKNDAENTSFLPPDDENITGEQIGSSFVYKDMALPIFWENPDAAKRYADCLAKYAERLDGKAKVYNLVIPSSIEFYLPKRYKSVTSPQRKNINSIYELMDDKITTVDAYSEIAAHTSEYLYFRTDHHWTARGAYYAYKAFAKAAGLTPTPLESMELRTLDKPFLGTLYSQTQDSNLAQNPDTLEYFIPSVNAVNYQYLTGSPYSPNKTTVWAEYAVGIYSYSLFLHGDFPLSHIQTENRNGKNILMVKESFGNAFAPFLINNYENIYVVDQRYFQLNLPAFVEQNNIQEVLFINNIFAAQTDIRTHELSRLFTQQFAPAVEAAPAEPEAPAAEAVVQTQAPAVQQPTQTPAEPTPAEQVPVTEAVEHSDKQEDEQPKRKLPPTDSDLAEEKERRRKELQENSSTPVRKRRTTSYTVPSPQEAQKLEEESLN